MGRGLSRRRFLRGMAAWGGAAILGPYILRGAGSSKKLGLAFIGTGGRGEAHLPLADEELCIAYCDVDKNAWGRICRKHPSAKGYTDYRKMLEKHEKDIDAVVVATPDHHHACASLLAMRMGKHVYCEKPLAWSVEEARALAEAAAARKVATQMGNQYHAHDGTRSVVEWIREGVIGQVMEVHTWSNRPIWPQGFPQRPPKAPVPPHVDWDCWIGPAPYRDFHEKLLVGDWRGWMDFGNGALGDMGCHTWDCVFWAMGADYPSTVEVVRAVGPCAESWPKQSAIKWSFPERNGRPAFAAWWYDGGLKPPAPEEFLTDPTRQKRDRQGNVQKPELPESGTLFIGTQGKLLAAGDYPEDPRLIPESAMRQFKRPRRSLPRSPGHHQEWLMACRGEQPWNYPASNFAEYAGPLTEVVLLGAMALRVGEEGYKLECDPAKRRITSERVLPFAGRRPRAGWTV